MIGATFKPNYEFSLLYFRFAPFPLVCKQNSGTVAKKLETVGVMVHNEKRKETDSRRQSGSNHASSRNYCYYFIED